MNKLTGLALAGGLTFTAGCSVFSESKSPESKTIIAQDMPTNCSPYTNYEQINGIIYPGAGERTTDEYYDAKLEKLSQVTGRELTPDGVIIDLAGCALNGSLAFELTDEFLSSEDNIEFPPLNVKGEAFGAMIDEVCVVVGVAGDVTIDQNDNFSNFEPFIDNDQQVFEVMCIDSGLSA